MRQAIAIVSFGSSVETARVQQISAVEKAIREEMPQALAYTAYTSPTIRRILRGRGIFIPSLEEALEQMLEDGITDALVQPTHLLYGIEYDKMRETVDAYAGRFASLQFGIPLLATTEDLRELAAILSEAYPRRCVGRDGGGLAVLRGCVRAAPCVLTPAGSPYVGSWGSRAPRHGWRPGG